MPILFIRGVIRIFNGNIDAKSYLDNIGKGHDQLWSAALGYNPDITVSDILGRKRDEGSKCAFMMCKILNFVFGHKDHCKGAREYDETLE